MSKLYNFKSAYPLIDTLYGVEVEEDDFEDAGLVAWDLINNKHTRLYRYVGDVHNGELQLPCNVDEIESVHVPINDAQMTSNKDHFHWTGSMFVEGYIDLWQHFDDNFNQRGKLVDYKEGDNVLYFKHNYPRVMVVYHGVLVDDEDGLPLINDKEQKAIAAYVAYRTLFKEGVRKKDQNSLALANAINTEWLKLCNSARIPEHLSQNDMNTILDAKTRWDRKLYGKSYKPIK